MLSAMRSIQRKIHRSIQIRGYAGTLQLCLQQPVKLIRERGPERRRRMVQQEFDRRHGTDTAAIVYLSDLAIDSPNADVGTRYGPTTQAIFEEILAGLDVDLRDYTFIDYGSGKGATLLYASEHPFRRAVGVEFAADLCRISERNVAVYNTPTRKCRDLETVCMDGALYPLPSGPLLLFFNSPFGVRVVERVLDTIERSLTEHPRELRVVYLNYSFDKEASGAMERARFLEKLRETGAYRIYAGRA